MLPGRAAARLRLVHDLVALLAHSHPAAVAQRLDARPRGLAALPADQHHVREVQGALALDDAALTDLLGRSLMPLDEVHPLDDHPLLLGQHDEHLAPLALLLAGDDLDRVVPLDRALRGCVSHRRPQITSGASEMIFMNCRSRSSRAIGPKIRVPIGLFWGFSSTAAFRSNLMCDPSGRRISLAVRTTTARATSPFFTEPSGVASLMATMIVSPIVAYFLFDPPMTRMHCTFLAPELSATSSIVRG